MFPFVSRCAARIDPTPKPLLFCLIADWLQHCAFWQSCELSLNSESLGALRNNVFAALKMKVALKVESPKNSTVHTFTVDYLLLFPEWLMRRQLRRSEIAISFHLLTSEVFVAWCQKQRKPLAFIEGKQCEFWRSCRIPQHLQQAEQLQLPAFFRRVSRCFCFGISFLWKLRTRCSIAQNYLSKNKLFQTQHYFVAYSPQNSTHQGVNW